MKFKKVEQGQGQQRESTRNDKLPKMTSGSRRWTGTVEVYLQR